MELTSEVVELLIQHSEVELNDAHNYKFVNTREELRKHDYQEKFGIFNNLSWAPCAKSNNFCVGS
jgi:hypothetical protein